MSLEDKFNSIDAAEIQGWVDGNRPEDLYFDFKSGLVLTDNAGLKNTLSKAISGFANSAGGIVCWGVDENDTTKTLILNSFDNASLYIKRLNDLTPTRTSPIVDGVMHRAVTFEDGKSCIITFIPKSDAAPHMCLVKKLYYKRSGSSHEPMEHFELEDMFGRGRKPKIEVLMYRNGDLGNRFEVKIRNVGAAIAKHFEMVVVIDGVTTNHVGGQAEDVSANNQGKTTYNLYAMKPIAPKFAVYSICVFDVIDSIPSATVTLSYSAEGIIAKRAIIPLSSIQLGLEHIIQMINIA